MKHWPTKPLAEIATVIRGVSFDKSQVSDEPNTNSIPILRAGNIQDSLLTDSDLVYVPDELVSEEQRMRRGDLAICMSSGSPTIVGKTAHLASDWRGAVGAFCAVVRFTPKLHHRFGSYWFRSPAFLQWRNSNAKGANIQNLRRTDLEKLSVPVPPIAEQERIVKLLDGADELRKLRAQTDLRTADLLPALFHEMFGDMSPKNWPMIRLGEVAEVKSGAGFPLDRQGLLDQPIPFFKVGDMNTPGNESEMHIFQHSISEATRKELGAVLLPAGSVIFPKVGAAIGTNKKRVLLRPSCVDNNVMAILPGDKILTKFILALLTAKDLLEFASNSNPPSIRKTTVEDWQIPLPPLPMQKEFAHRATEIRELEVEQAASRLRLDKLFQSMLHRAFSGEL